jgi:hypothetical protein
MRSPNAHKCRPCIRSAKAPVRPCISPVANPVTGFASQPSYSDPCHRSRYYRSCRHKSISLCDDSYYEGSGQLCDYFHHYNRNRCATALAAIIILVMFSQLRSQPEPHSQPLLQPALATTTQQLGNRVINSPGAGSPATQ